MKAYRRIQHGRFVMKNVLVISNNPLETTQHNAKTILSLLGNTDAFNIRQVYLKDGVPDYENATYYRISDGDILRSLLHPFPLAGEEVMPVSSLRQHNQSKKTSRSEFARLAREFMWKLGRIHDERMFEWIEKEPVDLIFFMGGDCWFAYDMYEKISERLPNVPSVIYLTDDYILPRKKINIVLTVRQKVLQRKMNRALNKADVLITISEEMRTEYRRIFNKDSFVYANVPFLAERKEKGAAEHNDDGALTLTYTGGLHYNRWKVLNRIGKAVQAYNRINHTRHILKVYSPLTPPKKIIEKLNVANGCLFCGALSSQQVDEVLSQSDVLVFVESFDPQSIASTKLSFSTKIYEYLSFQKPVLAVGPEDVSSMKFLLRCAYCITDPNEISLQSLSGILKAEKRKETAAACYEQYVAKSKSDFGKSDLVSKLLSL